jgi:hypothetical protein
MLPMLVMLLPARHWLPCGAGCWRYPEQHVVWYQQRLAAAISRTFAQLTSARQPMLSRHVAVGAESA